MNRLRNIVLLLAFSTLAGAQVPERTPESLDLGKTVISRLALPSPRAESVAYFSIAMGNRPDAGRARIGLKRNEDGSLSYSHEMDMTLGPGVSLQSSVSAILDEEFHVKSVRMARNVPGPRGISRESTEGIISGGSYTVSATRNGVESVTSRTMTANHAVFEIEMLLASAADIPSGPFSLDEFNPDNGGDIPLMIVAKSLESSREYRVSKMAAASDRWTPYYLIRASNGNGLDYFQEATMRDTRIDKFEYDKLAQAAPAGAPPSPGPAASQPR